MKLHRSCIAAFLFCISGLSNAGVNTWTVLGPDGGTINRIVFSPSGNVVFALTAGGLFRSTDGGGSWQATTPVPSNGPQGLAIDPSDSQRVYMAVPEGVLGSPSFLLSNDGGVSFQSIGALPMLTQAWQVAVSGDGQTVYMVGGARVFRSIDRGLNWAERTPVSSDSQAMVYRFVVDSSNAGVAYAAVTSSVQTALMKTVDAGQSWQTVYVDASGTSDVAVTPAAPAHLWAVHGGLLQKSIDAGATWTTVLTDTRLSSVAVAPSDAALAYAGNSDGTIYRSTNGGSSWSVVSGIQFAGSVYSIAIDPSRSTHVLVGGYAGLYGTADSGASWTAQQAGITASNVDNLIADSSSGRTYINASSDGIYYLASNSTTPQPVANLKLHELVSGNPSQPAQSIYITSMFAQPGVLLASLSNGVARSVDGGSSWTKQMILPLTGSQQIFNMTGTPAAPQTVIVAAHSSVLRSIDGGATWTAGGSGLPTYNDLANLRVAPSDALRVYALVTRRPPAAPYEQLGLWRSLDGGLSWSAVGDPATAPNVLLAVDPVAPDTLYGGRNSAFYRSTDGGVSWSALNLGNTGNGAITAVAIDPQHPQTLYVGGDRVLRTLDGSATWEVLRSSSTRPILFPSVALLDVAHPGTLLLGISGHGVQAFTVAPDLRLTGTAPGAAAIGAPLTINVALTNLGPFGTTGAVIHLQWPAGSSNVVVTAPGASCAVAASFANCTYPVLRNADSAGITLMLTSASAGTVRVDASASSDLADLAAANNTVSLSTVVSQTADLSVTASGDADATVNGAVSYTLVARNAGPNTAVSPTLSFQLASGLAPGAVTTTAGSCSTSASGLVVCELGDMAPNATVTLRVTATANSTGAQVSSAHIASSATDAIPADNAATVSTSVAAAPPPSSGSGGNGGSGGGGGGGGGSTSWLELLALGVVVVLNARRRVSVIGFALK